MVSPKRSQRQLSKYPQDTLFVEMRSWRWSRFWNRWKKWWLLFWFDSFSKFCYNAITQDGYKTNFYNSGTHDVGSTVEISGTVKKHAENVTILNRVKIKEIN